MWAVLEINPIDFDRRSAVAAPKCVVINPPPDDSHVYRFFVGGRNLHIVMVGQKNLGSIVSRRERLVQCSDAMGIVAIDSNVLEEE